jgi:hypothetical protein
LIAKNAADAKAKKAAEPEVKTAASSNDKNESIV